MGKERRKLEVMKIERTKREKERSRVQYEGRKENRKDGERKGKKSRNRVMGKGE